MLVEIRCDSPPAEGDNTTPVPKTYAAGYGGTYVYKCKPGYIAAESCQSMVSVCQKDGSWSYPEPACIGKWDLVNSIKSWVLALTM